MRETWRNFGSYRVEVIVTLFPRLVDIHNFECIIFELNSLEIGCVYCRLGWLNIFNPCKPDGAYELDLAQREQRMVAKIFCQLAVIEPGENWTFAEYRHNNRDDDAMPGWDLSERWLTIDGFPSKGILRMCYFSGAKANKKGCKPAVIIRRSFLSTVLIDEREVFAEDCDSQSDYDIKGMKLFRDCERMAIVEYLYSGN